VLPPLPWSVVGVGVAVIGTSPNREATVNTTEKTNGNANCPRSSWDETLTVTFDLRNKYLIPYPDRPWSFTRWLKVRVMEPGHPCVVHVVGYTGEDILADIETCKCGKKYAVRHSDRWEIKLCRACDTAKLTATTKAYRKWKRARTLRPTCTVCGSAMVSERRTRRYCSTKCRVAHFREAKS
jgi:hypothetical protein